jgi:MFS family permease
LIAVGLAVSFSLFGDTAMYVVLPVHQAALGLTAMQVGMLLSINRWIRLVTNGVAERMIRRYGSSVLFPASLLVGSAVSVAYAMAPRFWILVLLRAVWGVCWSFIRQTGVMTTISVSHLTRAGRSMGIYVALLQVGFVAGTFLSGVVFDASGYRVTFLVAAALSLTALPLALLALALLARLNPPGSDGSPSTRPLASNGASRLLQIRGFIVTLVGTGMVMSTLGYLLRNRFGDSLPVGGLVIGVTTINGALLASRYLINGVGSPLFGALLDRHGLKSSQVTGFAAAGVTLLAAVLFGQSVLLVPFVVLFFVAATFSRLAIESEAAVAGPRAYSGLATAMDLGAAVGPLVGWTGIQVDRSMSVFWIGGGLFLVAALLAVDWRNPCVPHRGARNG